MKFAYGNWKMSQSLANLQKFFAEFSFKNSNVEVGIFPTALHIPASLSRGYLIGAQDCSTEKEGAFTGELSAQSIKELGAGAVLVGHSERRQRGAETNGSLRKKAERALEAGLKVVFCIGETDAERTAGQTEDVLEDQLTAVDGISSSLIIAYEPVWAIGTGRVASAEDVKSAHQFVWSRTPKALGVLYGGSVKPDNSQVLARIEGVSGFLIGGASLQAGSLTKIAESLV